MIELSANGKSFQAHTNEPEGMVQGGLIVIHEVWGLTDHIKHVADRFADEGYFVIAPDLLSDTGIDFAKTRDLQEALFDPERKNEAQPKLRELMSPLQAPDFAESTRAKLKACFDFLASREDVDGKVAVVGFCFGGSYSFTLAVSEPRLRAAVAFYGHADYSISQLSKITCPVLAFYGRNDTNLMAGLEDLKGKMALAGVNFSAKVYDHCGHAFFNDTNRFAYNAPAAKDAWKVTREFLATYL